MVVSLNTQIIWIDKYANYWKDENKKAMAYSLNENNEKIYGQFSGVDKIYVDPIGYYDLDMVYHEWQENYSFESPYSFMVKIDDSDQYDNIEKPILWQINLKLTKGVWQ